MQNNMAVVVSSSLASGFMSVTNEEIELQAFPKITDLFPNDFKVIHLVVYRNR
jgi:hypothetical protein